MHPKIKELISAINQYIEPLEYGKHPKELYEPINYIMSLGGKRMRPLLTVLAYSLYKENELDAIPAASAVEIFHNFSLLHDDIMDDAPLRRGKATVHEKWNANVAILSGDVMLVKAYEQLIRHIPEHKLKHTLDAFNKCAAEVCEGQQVDMNFEGMQQVDESAYLEMIRQKTAVLLGFSLQLGGILANVNADDELALYDLGLNMGMGFQLKDDLLDVYAEQEKFGKQVGGDIISNKKTFLLINALQRADSVQNEKLQHWINIEKFDKEEKVNAVKSLYDELGIYKITEQKMNAYFDLAFQALNKLNVEPSRKEVLKSLMDYLIEREQ